MSVPGSGVPSPDFGASNDMKQGHHVDTTGLTKAGKRPEVYLRLRQNGDWSYKPFPEHKGHASEYV